MIRSTHTHANLEVSDQTYDEVARLLKDAGYDHVFASDGAIDMHGIALVRKAPAVIRSTPLPPPPKNVLRRHSIA